MPISMNLNRQIAALTLRLILGFIFLMQGFGKVFTWGVEDIYHREWFYGTYKDLLPHFIIHATAYYTSYIELIAGALLVLGLKRNYALYALASVLVIVTFGHGLADPIWNLSHVLYRTMLLVALLIIPVEWDKFSLDNMIAKNRISSKK